MDVKGEVEVVHQPCPHPNRRHVTKLALHIDAEQSEERQEEMAKDDDHSDPKPRPSFANDIPERLLRDITVPDDEVLREMDVSVEHGKREHQRADEIKLVLMQHFRQHAL